MERIRATVRGSVQGVGYRQWAARQARALGVTGRVWNTPEGAVEVVAEAERAVLREWLAALRHGPADADVVTVTVQWGAAEGTWTDFAVTW